MLSNIVYNSEALKDLGPMIQMVKTEYHNPETGEDGPIKWTSILQCINALSWTDSYTNILEIGAGNSVLPIMMADQQFEVTAIDKHILNNSVTKDIRIESEIIDAFEYLKNIPNNSLDIVVDSCSIIHYDISPYYDGDHSDEHAYNTGCVNIAKLLSQKLKPDGLFITVSDFALKNGDNEFMSLDNLMECYHFGGLKLLGKIPEINDPYKYDYGKTELGIVRLIYGKN